MSADPGFGLPVAPTDPWRLLTLWLPTNTDPDRPQIVLSTVDAAGAPDARTVLLSEFDENGFYFHTDSRSRKAAHIAANPAVAITVLWPGFTRQLVIQGRAEVAPAAEIASAYAARSPYLQQLARLNSKAFAELVLSERRSLWAAFAAEHAHTAPDQPASWTGFLVRPTRLTFWTSNSDAASHRLEYTRVDDAAGWSLGRLPG